MPSRNKSPFSILPSTYSVHADDFVHFDEALFPFQDFDELDFTTKDNQYPQNATLESFYPSQTSISPVQSTSDMSDSYRTTTADDDWLASLNPELLSSSPEVRDPSKRTRDTIEGDAKNACWTSPLCPSRKDGNSRPDSCRGECADYLFALPPDTSYDKETTPEISAKVVLTPPLPIEGRQSSKRSSDSSRREEPTPPPNVMSSTSPEKSDKPKRRVPHSQVEKKYRENVNSQLEALRRAVPLSRTDSGYPGYDIEDLGANARQPSKATILSNATAYIKQLEKETERMKEDLANLKSQNRTLQLVLNGNSASLLNSIERWKIENNES